jgi:hypothetical protein
MTIFNHNNNEITIPQHISKWGVISAHTFFVSSLIIYSKNWTYMSIHFFLLYLTTVAHWNYPRKKGIIRNIDIFTAVMLKIHGTYESLFLSNHYKFIWFSVFLTSSTMFLFNEFLYYHQITKYNNNNNSNYNNNNIEKILLIKILPKTQFFSLIPTSPNTKEREYAYKRSTITHIFFIHFLPQISALYCILNNNKN